MRPTRQQRLSEWNRARRILSGSLDTLNLDPVANFCG
jgi:hypothetical protein